MFISLIIRNKQIRKVCYMYSKFDSNLQFAKHCKTFNFNFWFVKTFNGNRKTHNYSFHQTVTSLE